MLSPTEFVERHRPSGSRRSGKRDVIVPSGSNWWWLHHTSGTTFSFDPVQLANGSNVPATGANGDAWTGDVNGDGLDDLIWAVRASQTSPGSRRSPTCSPALPPVRVARRTERSWPRSGPPATRRAVSRFSDERKGRPGVAPSGVVRVRPG